MCIALCFGIFHSKARPIRKSSLPPDYQLIGLDHPQKDDVLEGTTRRVFRFLYRRREPTRIHDIQRGLGLSSPSVAYYHVNKLLKAGLVKETGDGYAADKVIFENMIRIRKTTLPAQAAYAAFFLLLSPSCPALCLWRSNIRKR